VCHPAGGHGQASGRARVVEPTRQRQRQRQAAGLRA
jgi:hypothetical protein